MLLEPCPNRRQHHGAGSPFASKGTRYQISFLCSRPRSWRNFRKNSLTTEGHLLVLTEPHQRICVTNWCSHCSEVVEIYQGIWTNDNFLVVSTQNVQDPKVKIQIGSKLLHVLGNQEVFRENSFSLSCNRMMNITCMCRRSWIYRD